MHHNSGTCNQGTSVSCSVKGDSPPLPGAVGASHPTQCARRNQCTHGMIMMEGNLGLYQEEDSGRVFP